MWILPFPGNLPGPRRCGEVLPGVVVDGRTRRAPLDGPAPRCRRAVFRARAMAKSAANL